MYKTLMVAQNLYVINVQNPHGCPEFMYRLISVMELYTSH